MIIKSRVRGNGVALAKYLLEDKKNERAEVLEQRGWDMPKVKDAFRMSEEIALSTTQCKNPFYHVSFRAAPGEALTARQWQQCADRLEARLGLAENSRVLVLHTFKGEQHLHVVWDRIDERTLKAVNLYQDRPACIETARALEKELGLLRVRERPREQTQAGEGRTQDGKTAARFPEEQQARRAELSVNEIRDRIRGAWEQSDRGDRFAAALEAQGLLLAKGDRRDYVAVDAQGGVYSLGKRTTGASAQEVRARLADLDLDQVPNVEQAREQLQAHTQDAAPAPVREPLNRDEQRTGAEVGARTQEGAPPESPREEGKGQEAEGEKQREPQETESSKKEREEEEQEEEQAWAEDREEQEHGEAPLTPGRGGIGVFDPVTGMRQTLGSFANGLFQLLMCEGPPQPPTPQERLLARQALRNVGKSLVLGQDVSAADVRSLSLSDLHQLRSEGGEEHLRSAAAAEAYRRERAQEYGLERER